MFAPALSRAPATAVLTEVRSTGRAAVPGRMRWLLSLPRTGGGLLYAARSDRDGHRRVCARPLSYLDTEAGRVIATVHEAGDGTSWHSLIPADPPLLVRRLDALLPR